MALTPGTRVSACDVTAPMLTGVTSDGQPPAAGTPAPTYVSRIMIYDLKRKSSTLVHQGDGIWEAPNWSRAGGYLLVNSQGKLYRFAADGRSKGHSDRTSRVQLRMIDMPGETPGDVAPQVVVELTGGQGTINENSWSPDSTKLANVTFEAVPPKSQ